MKEVTEKQLEALTKGRLNYTKERAQKIVLTRKLKNNYKQSKQTKTKISETLKNKFKNGELIHSWTGKKQFKEQLEKLSHIRLGTKPTINQLKALKKGWKKGELNINWKGGVSKLYKTERQSIKYHNWRTAIFKRDNFTCQECNKYGGHLEAHHIKSWANNSKLRFNIDNGETLCKPCHELTNNYKNKGGKN